MAEPGFWVDENTFVLYKELEEDVVQSFIKPVGGFCFPADLFALRKLPAVPFYVKDWLPKLGKGLLYAPAKAGKSKLCLQLARCIGVGADFLGLPTSTGKVLYIQLEMGEAIFQGRIKETRQSYENVYVGTTFSAKLDSKGGQDYLWKALEAVRPNVLIIDPLYKTISGDENESQDMRKILDWFDAVIEGFADSFLSIFIIDHPGKDLSKRARGSSIKEDWVDSYISMKKISKIGEPLRIEVKPIYFRHAPLTDSFKAELNDSHEFELCAEATTVKQTVQEFIKASKEPVESKDLFEAEIGSNTSVYSALKELVKEGKISKVGRGKYGGGT